MELSGEVAIGKPPQRVWEAINDPDVLRACIPGCEEVRQVGPAETHVRVLMKMGPVRARFVGKIFMRDVRPGAGCVLDFEGSGGAAGFARGSSTVLLTPAAGAAGGPADATTLGYSATASIGGKLGQIGGRMIDASAKQMADQFFHALRARLDAPADAGAAGMAAPPVGSPLPAMASASNHLQPAPGSQPGAAMPMRMPSAASAQPGIAGESVRILWFLLGAASTGFGVWLAGHLAR